MAAKVKRRYQEIILESSTSKHTTYVLTAGARAVSIQRYYDYDDVTRSITVPLTDLQDILDAAKKINT